MISRGVDSSSTFSEEDLIRAASPSRRTSGVVMTDGASSPPATVRAHRGVVRSSTAGPRLPQRRYPSASTSPTRRVGVESFTGGRRSPPDTARRPPERADSGLGLEMVTERPVPNPVPARRRYLPRGCTDSDDDVETDRGTVVTHHYSSPSLGRPGTNMPVHPSKSAPTVTSNYTYTPHTRSSSELMATQQQRQFDSRFDSERYQKHLLDIQHKAIEQDRLQQGLLLLLPNNDGDTGLHQAIIHNQPLMVSRLLELISKYPQLKNCLDDQNSLYQTPLHLALHLQQHDVIGQLLQAGASPYLQDHKGNTPLHIACGFPNSKCLTELLRHMTRESVLRAVEIRNFQGLTCLHSAVMSKNKEALLTLRKAGVHIDLQDHHSGKTPLHLATELGSFEIVQLLVQSCNSDFNATTFSNCTPLHIAAGYSRLELVAYFISLGANPFALTDEGDLPLDLAVQDNIRIFLSNMTEMYYS